jgi:hypothetical protein
VHEQYEQYAGGREGARGQDRFRTITIAIASDPPLFGGARIIPGIEEVVQSAAENAADSAHGSPNGIYPAGQFHPFHCTNIDRAKVRTSAHQHS